MAKSKLRFKVGVRVIDGLGTVSLRDKKVVLSSRPDCTFCFLSKNKIGCTEGEAQHIYQRQRRGAHITWLDSLAGGEPSVVTGDLEKQLELADRLMETESLRARYERLKAKAASAGGT